MAVKRVEIDGATAFAVSGLIQIFIHLPIIFKLFYFNSVNLLDSVSVPKGLKSIKRNYIIMVLLSRHLKGILNTVMF